MLSCTAPIDLAETFEQVLCILIGKSASCINNVEFYVKLVLPCLVMLCLLSAASYKYFTFLREFDSVPNDIQKNLTDAKAISLNLDRNIILDQIV